MMTQKITFILGNKLKEMDCLLKMEEYDADEGKVIKGQFLDFDKSEMASWLGPIEDGALGATVNGRSYRMTQLLSDGAFTLQPNF
jgi:hypothetical protein